MTILNSYYSFGEASQCYYGYLKRDTLALQIHSGTQMKYYDVLDLVQNNLGQGILHHSIFFLNFYLFSPFPRELISNLCIVMLKRIV